MEADFQWSTAAYKALRGLLPFPCRIFVCKIFVSFLMDTAACLL